MKVIITGASGNLGSHLLNSNDFHSLGIGRSDWDKLDDIKAGEYDAVIHTAYDLKKSITQFPVENLDSNILSTARILKICAEKKIKKFGFVSSCAVYGDSSNSSEDKTCAPVTMNGHIKLFNEELVKSFCKSNGINFQIYRVFNTYGGSDEFSVVQKMIKSTREKKVFQLVNEGISERDYIHVQDAASIINQLISMNLTNEVINIGTGESVRIIDLLRVVEKKYGAIQVENVDNSNESVFSRANVKKLKSLVSYRPRKILEFLDSQTF